MGVHVALQFQEVDDGIPRKGESRPTWPKALHIEINMVEQSASPKHNKKLYSSKATTFPLGTKMWLVRDYCLLTNTHAKAKAASLCTNQHRFLQQMETCNFLGNFNAQSPRQDFRGKSLPPDYEYPRSWKAIRMSIPCNQINVIYVSSLLKEFEYELKEIDEGICGADHRGNAFGDSNSSPGDWFIIPSTTSITAAKN